MKSKSDKIFGVFLILVAGVIIMSGMDISRVRVRIQEVMQLYLI
ncbi:MAG: hypothetical protein ACK5LZ_01125 [Anaerorhabdus sp.]